MTTTIEGLSELLAKRKQLDAYNVATEALGKAGLVVPPELFTRWFALSDELLTVTIPCLICHVGVTHTVEVGGTETPRAALCGPCADAPDAHIVR